MTNHSFFPAFIAGLVAIGLVAGCTNGNSASPAATQNSQSGSPAPQAPPPPPGALPPPPGASTANGSATLPTWVGQSSTEPFSVQAFLTQRAGPTENAASLYPVGLAMISRDMGGPSAAQLDSRIASLSNLQALAAGQVASAEIRQLVASASPAMKKIDEAQSKLQCVFPTELTVDAQLPHAMAARTLARLTCLELADARNSGDFDQAEAAIRRCLRLSRDLRPRGPMVCQIVSMAIDGVVLGAIEQITLRDPKLTTAQCDRILALLVEHQQLGVDPFAEGLRMDYIMSRNSIHDLQTGRLTLAQLYEFMGGEPIDSSLLSGPTIMNFSAEVSACDRIYGLALKAASNPVARADEFASLHAELARMKADWDAFHTRLKATDPASRRNLVAEMPAMQFHVWIAGIEPSRQACRRIATNVAGLQMLLALRRFELANRRLPATLAEAASATILKTVPVDTYSGQALQLVTIAGQPTIYSIGNDLKDDGGRIDWKQGTVPGDFLFVLNR